MARIEMTTAIRRSPEEIHRYLADFRNHATFLPSSHFRALSFPGDPDQPARKMRLELYLMGRWWPVELENAGEQPGKELVQTSEPPVKLRTTWSISPLKTDRRSVRSAVRLTVEYELPGGALGRLLDGLLLKNEATKMYDRAIRQLPIAIEGPPKSGLKSEEP